MRSILCFSMLFLGVNAFTQEIFHVQADQGWQNTNIQITAGQNLVIFAVGNVSIDIQDQFTYYGPCGILNAAPTSNLPLATTHVGALIGKIGSGQPFGIGEFTVFAPGGQGTPNESGILSLRVNDADANLSDNAGSYSVFICKDVNINLATVQASQGWQNTGTNIIAGEPYIVYTKGVWTMDQDEALTWHGAGGVTNAVPGANLPLSTTHVGALIGRIGSGQPFGIGEYTVFALGGQGYPTTSGPLQLRINDNDSNLGDNDGLLKVFVFSDFSPVGIQGNMVLNKFLELKQNYPNPFTNNTSLEYSLPYDCQMKLSLYSNEGKLIKCLIDKYQVKGDYMFQLSSSLFFDSQIIPGVYYYQLESNGMAVTKKMIVIN